MRGFRSAILLVVEFVDWERDWSGIGHVNWGRRGEEVPATLWSVNARKLLVRKE